MYMVSWYIMSYCASLSKYCISIEVHSTLYIKCFTIFLQEFSFVLMFDGLFYLFLFTPSCSVHFHKHCTPHKSLQTTVTCEGNLKWAEHLNHDSLCNG